MVGSRSGVHEGEGNLIHPSNTLRNHRKRPERARVSRGRSHDLRLTHATWLITGGNPITSDSERLRHAKSSVTLHVFAHAVTATQDRAALAVSALLFGGDELPAKVGS